MLYLKSLSTHKKGTPLKHQAVFGQYRLHLQLFNFKHFFPLFTTQLLQNSRERKTIFTDCLEKKKVSYWSIIKLCRVC